ncbi:MAG: hypothetical protein CMP54_00820 [Flavobacteriales bacterium]|nr:hypothetical protein [Flavobacteriales bacterium]
MKSYLLILLIAVSGFVYPQTAKDENIAKEYYKQGEFLKASQIFEKIFKKKKTKSIYVKYVDCLIKIQSYNKAERVIKTFYKKTNDPTLLIDLGEIYIKKGEEGVANKKFQLAISETKKNSRYTAALGAKFLKTKNYDLALKVYQIAKKEANKPSYSIQLANIYSALGEVSKMYEEIIELLYSYPNYLQTCKNKLRITISDDSENENNQKLKKILIKNIQKNNSYEISKLLVWLFMQEKEFQKALEYEISIDKRIADNQLDIINLGDIAFKNKNYTTAKNAFQYILTQSHKKSYYYEYASIEILNIEFEILLNQKIKQIQQIENLSLIYKSTLNQIGLKSETIFTLKNYCNILSMYLDKEDEAIDLLNQAINNQTLNEYDVAICKMELAKILTLKDEVWESTLLYAQVEKKFNEEVIGQQAKFEKTKINYYKGDFEWAQNQLKVLKLSTSKLIANDAMKLSLLISDNLNLDTSSNALLLYAKAELLFEQKKYKDCLQKLDQLTIEFPTHTLIDEVLLKKADVFIAQKNYTNALNCLEKICLEHQYDILYDDALFYKGQIYEKILEDKTKAKDAYENILLKTPNSIFINEARNKYKLLRRNNFLNLQ